MRGLAAVFLFLTMSGAAWACDAAKAGFAIGQNWSDALAEEARAKAGAALVRRMIRGRAYTMEFRGERLNLHTGETPGILSVSCG